MMTEFTTSYLAELTASLSAEILKGIGRKLREKISGTEKEQAIERCLHIGLAALLASASASFKDELDQLSHLFRKFFAEPDVGKELGALLRGHPLNREELLYLFEHAGFDATTLPGVSFERALTAFEAAFLIAATDERELQGTMQTNQLLTQAHLQRALLDEMRAFADFLREAHAPTLQIQNGKITAQSQTGGEKIVYQFTSPATLGARSALVEGSMSGGVLSTGDLSVHGDVVGRDKKEISAQTYIEQQIINAQPAVDASRLREAYLNHLFESSRQLSLSGIDPNVASKAETRLHLDGVYTALLTLAPEMHERLERGVMPEKETRRLSALEQLNRQAHLVLLGDPGSGKSTFVNFVALCFAGELLRYKEANLALLTSPLPAEKEDDEKKNEPQPWQHGALLPVRIILRDFAARGLPEAGQKANANHLWNFIAAELEPATLSDYAPHLKSELREKGGLLLLDGLDEVPESQQRRIQIKQAVEDFAACFPRCRMLVTSRTYAYQKQDWRLPDFAQAVLAPFSAGQIRGFVEHWYDHIAASRGWHRDDARGHAELLKRAIFGSKNLQALAERPLLLTLMVSLHAWRGGSLSEKREQLYADTVDLLLDWWESPKTVRDAKGEIKVLQPSLAEWLKIDKQKVRELLNELAYLVHRCQPDLQGTADIAESDLVQKLIRLSPDPDIKPARLVEFLSQRAGLLLPRGEGVYTFPHRTFQEYLAACYLTDHEYPDKLTELAKTDPNRWREVALLAAAKASRGSDFAVWALVDHLCYNDPEKGKVGLAEIWGAHLAGQALVESANLSRVSERNQAKVDLVKKWLVHILRRNDFPATERALAGNALAHLGDTRREVMTIEEMQFCLVPAGPFWMGSEESDDEKPLHLNEVLNYDYWISRYPITNAQFAEFVKAGGYKEARYWPEAKAAEVWQNGKVKGWRDRPREADQPRKQPYDFGPPFNLPNHPVVGITWYEALAFSRWLNEFCQNKNWLDAKISVQLPSEAEWEKSARGGVEIPHNFVIVGLHEFSAKKLAACQKNPQFQRRYPWGDQAESNRANYSDTGIGATSTVGCFSGGASPYGCEDMSGNVWGWTRSLWGENLSEPDFKYPYKLDDGREQLDAPDDVRRALRGCAFFSDDLGVRCAYRSRNGPNLRNSTVGFRVSALPLL